MTESPKAYKLRYGQNYLRLYKTRKFCDCQFVVGVEPNVEVFSAHRLILASASPVFESMFYGSMPEGKEPIVIPDCEPAEFRSMIVAIYSDTIKIASFSEASKLYYLATKYMLPCIQQVCLNWIDDNLCPSNACFAYEFAQIYDQGNILKQSVDMIERRTSEVLKASTFNDIKISTLLYIFDKSGLNIQSELELFNALHKYAEARGYLDNEIPYASDQLEGTTGPDLVEAAGPVDKGAVSTDGERAIGADKKSAIANAKEAINKSHMVNALKKIRFLTLTTEQFAEVAVSKLFALYLSHTETLSLSINITMGVRTPDTFPIPEGFSTMLMSRPTPEVKADLRKSRSPKSPKDVKCAQEKEQRLYQWLNQ